MTIAPDRGPDRPPPPWRRWGKPAIALGFLGVLCGVVGLWLGLSGGGSPASDPQASSQAAPEPVRVTVLVRVRSATEPLPGAHTRIVGPDGTPSENMTDAAGEARVSAPLGFLRIEVNGRGYARALAHAEARAGEPLTVELTLEPERVLQGSVLDDQGEPVPGAKVHVLSLDALDMSGWDAEADDDGRFRVPGLPRHELSLEVIQEGHEGHERALGETYDDEVLVVLARQGELLVTVRDATGKPASDAELLVTGTGLWPAASARADQAGEHLFTRLSSGEYRARSHRGAFAALPSAAMQVVPGSRTRVELVLAPAARICGTVLDARGDLPVSGARVSVFDPTPGIPARTGESDGDGTFELLGLWPGEARLEVVHDGYAPLAANRRLVVGETGCPPLRLSGAATVLGTVIDESGRAVADALVSVSTREGLPVTFRDEPGAGVALVGELGVTHGPVPRIPLNAPTAFTMGALAAHSDAAGAFRIAGLVPSPIALHVARAGYAPTTLVVDRLEPHETRGDLRLVLRAAGRIEGRLSDARGRGVPGVYLSARATDMEQSAITDADGSFVIPDVLGDVSVEATASGYAPVACHVTVHAGQVARCALPLDSTLHELAVRVEDERGAPLSGALVSVRAASSTRTLSQVSNASGEVLVRELPEPPYLVDIAREGYLSVEKQRVERVGRELRIGLSRAASLSGVVLDVMGRPVRGAFVSTDEGDATADSDASGNFILSGVAPGALFVWAKHKRAGEGESAEVRARPGELLADVRIVLDGRYVPSTEDGEPNVKPAPAPTPTPTPSPTVASAVAPAAAPRPPQALTLDQRGPKVLVSQVGSGSPGEQAGMRAGDFLLSVDGETVFSAAQARGMLRDPPGTSAAVRVSRDGRVLSLRFRRASR